MARSFRERRSPINPKVLIFPLLMGTVGWFALRGGTGGMNPAPTSNRNEPTVSISSAQVSSTLVLLERPSPTQDRDERFVYDVERGMVEATSTEPGWRIGSSSAQLTRRTEDGVWLLVDQGASVVLRDRRGASYKDPMLVGAFDKDVAAVVAIASDRRVLLSVARNGSIRELASLSDQTFPLGIEDGRIWFVESAPQEGIEIPPHGPSSVWSVDRSGVTSTRIVDERNDRLVNHVMVNGKHLILGTDKGDMQVMFDGDLPAFQEGQPLVWLPNDRLLIVQRGLLCVLHYPPLACGPKAPSGITQATLFNP